MPQEGKKTDLEGRYALVSIRSDTPPAEIDSDDENRPKNYASFLLDKDRVMGPDGYVDSKSVQYQYMKKQEALKKQREEDELAQQDYYNSEARRKAVSAFQVSAETSQDQQNYELLLRTLENKAVQKKQEERELKRKQGDIKKTEQSMRKESKEYDKDVSSKRVAEERRMAEIRDRTMEAQRQHVFSKEKASRQRRELTMYAEVEHKDSGRKTQVATSELSRTFRAKLTELENRQSEAQRISEEYERKLRAKEEMQNQLKRELNDLALALNMEVQKGQQKEEAFNSKKKRSEQQRLQEDRDKQVALDDNIKATDNDYKAVNRSLRHLSAELTLTRAHMQMKQREETRHKQDTQIRLKQNQEQQSSLSDAAYKTELDMKAKESDEKVQRHLARRNLLASQRWNEKKEKKEQSEAENSVKFQQRYAEQTQAEHEDNLRHFQKAVERGEMAERSLFERAKNAEHARQKQSQAIRQLQKTLAETKQQNALKLQAELADIAKQEHELTLQIQKEKAALEKVHAQREEAYYSLLTQREKLREDRHFLTEHQREYRRLQRIGARSQSSS